MWQKTEPFALPAELRAQIGHLSIKKVMKNGFLRYSILRGKSEKPDRKLEGKIGQVMEVHMDANRTLSQLSYRPISYSNRANERPNKLYYNIVLQKVKSEFCDRSIFSKKSGHGLKKWIPAVRYADTSLRNFKVNMKN